MSKRNSQSQQTMYPALANQHAQLEDGSIAREAWAVLSQARTYRYRLARVWDSHMPRLGVVGHSWSATNEWRSDRTVRRCIGFARAWGYGGIDIGNLFGLQGGAPGTLGSAADPIGPDNDAHLAAMCAANDLILLAWGEDVELQRERPVGLHVL